MTKSGFYPAEMQSKSEQQPTLTNNIQHSTTGTDYNHRSDTRQTTGSTRQPTFDNQQQTTSTERYTQQNKIKTTDNR